MKRFLCILLSIVMVSVLLGCSSRGVDPVSFYYCRESDSYQYFDMEGVISSEPRDLTEHRGNLKYILGLYLAGPIEEGLVSPFPRNVQLQSVTSAEGTLQIELSDLGTSMSDAQFSLACACLTLTCTDVSSYREVTVISGSRNLTMNADSLLLYDDVSAEQPTNGG